LKILAIIPVYRDVAAAVRVLKRFRIEYVDTIFLVVDGSTKNEEKLISETTEEVATPIFMVFNKNRKGVGSAIRNGIEYGIANGYDIAVVMAGNEKDDPQEIPRLLAPLLSEGCDYVQGSRFLIGGKKVKNPFFRRNFSRLYPFVWNILTKTHCSDVTNGFRAYRLKLFADPKINIWQSWLDEYELEYYLHYKALTLGYRVKEVPVSKVYNQNHKGGYSQISPFRDWWKIVSPLIYLWLGAKN
jgi:dolichol-phosphate mannosyltransferase